MWFNTMEAVMDEISHLGKHWWRTPGWLNMAVERPYSSLWGGKRSPGRSPSALIHRA